MNDLKEKYEALEQTHEEQIKPIIEKAVNQVCRELDLLMKQISVEVSYNNALTIEQLERYIIELPTNIYFCISQLEKYTSKQALAKAQYDLKVKRYKTTGTGKIAEKEYNASVEAFDELIIKNIYKSIADEIQAKIDASSKTLDGLKKAMSLRITEVELSKSRFIERG